MAPIGSGTSYCDFRYVNWWRRTFSGPKCPHCKKTMKFAEILSYPSNLVWDCELCDWFTFFKVKMVNIDSKVELNTLYYKGKWILRTTETGIEVNGEVAWYRVAWAYTKYVYYKVRGRV